jgi:hypothetical protein
LLSNDRNLTPVKVLEAPKGQTTTEKRFEQIKTVHEIDRTGLSEEATIH